jgi:SpoVK/Ycf46/Vps4 family AAA+-type ATPase
MASANQIKALLESYLKGDDKHFYAVAMQLAAHEAKLGHGKLAEEIRALIDNAKKSTSPQYLFKQNHEELQKLFHVSYPKIGINEIVLEDKLSKRLQRIIKEQRHFVKIRSYGLFPRRKILLVGPPGTGKTLTASVLANELGLPLLQVRFDSLIAKFMGETAAKLRLIFNAIADTRAVYFFDEFDAIGSQRGLSNDVGEIRRILNSFLQLIEQDQSNSLIIAATNHPEILDYALFRRFDDVLDYNLPQKTQILTLLKNKLCLFETCLDWDTVVSAAEGMSYTEIVRAAGDTIKDMLIYDKQHITQDSLLVFLSERKKAQMG